MRTMREESPGGPASRRTGVALREALPWHELLQVVETAEETGYEAVLVPEIRGREAFATLAGFAAATSRIRLGPGVLPITSRAPTLAAMGAATVHEASGGRFLLGVGSGRTRSGAVDLVREYVRQVRAALGGEVVRSSGPFAVEGFRLGMEPPRDPLPVWIGALGARMVELAGEVGDGVLLNWCTPERVAKAREELARGAERAGRDPAALTVVVYVRACLGHEEGHALEALAPAAGEYAGFPNYARQFETMGLGGPARAAAAGDPRGGETLARALCVWGVRTEAGARLAEWRDAGADLVVAYPVPALEPLSSILGTVLAAAPSPAGEH
jgi:alkanesulfonate monooxygenase SsuD/methylene tetrahydromethanopterin reductase-like flavin-dependent oxidoreductase (luciferase family)